MPDALTPVDFWLDPHVPLGLDHLTLAARGREGPAVEARWHVMSLSMLNKDRELSEDYRRSMDRAWGPVRVCMAAVKAKGDDILLPMYTAIGTRVHDEGRRDPEVLAEALADVGLPAELATATESTEFDEAIEQVARGGHGLVGDDVGTPIIRVGPAAIFGPVVTPIPRGEAAGGSATACCS